MSKDQIQTGQAQEHWNVSKTRILKYTVEIKWIEPVAFVRETWSPCKN